MLWQILCAVAHLLSFLVEIQVPGSALGSWQAGTRTDATQPQLKHAVEEHITPIS